MAILHGRNSKVTLNAVEVCVTGFSINTTVAETDSSTTCDGGFTTSITGQKNATWSFDVFYDDAAQESAGVLSAVEEGDTVSLEMFANNADIAPWFDAPTARITAIAGTSSVGGAITISYSGNSNGEYAWKGEVTT